MNLEPICYPVRRRIVDPDGAPFAPGLVCRTPAISKPHIGKEGLAERLDGEAVRVALDDGTVLMGYECWWEPIEPGGKG